MEHNWVLAITPLKKVVNGHTVIRNMMADDDSMNLYSESLFNLVCNLNDLK